MPLLLSFTFTQHRSRKRDTMTQFSRVQPMAPMTLQSFLSVGPAVSAQPLNRSLSHKNLLRNLKLKLKPHWLGAGPSHRQAALRYVSAWKRCTNIIVEPIVLGLKNGDSMSQGLQVRVSHEHFFSSLTTLKLRLQRHRAHFHRPPSRTLQTMPPHQRGRK